MEESQVPAGGAGHHSQNGAGFLEAVTFSYQGAEPALESQPWVLLSAQTLDKLQVYPL
jgi:hypothetical protein